MALTILKFVSRLWYYKIFIYSDTEGETWSEKSDSEFDEWNIWFPILHPLILLKDGFELQFLFEPCLWRLLHVNMQMQLK